MIDLLDSNCQKINFSRKILTSLCLQYSFLEINKVYQINRAQLQQVYFLNKKRYVKEEITDEKRFCH